jgi:PAS domain S-box-containing protein
MSFVVVFDTISSVAAMLALIIFVRGWHRAMPRDIKVMLLGLLGLSLFHHSSNLLEWARISDMLDPVEDYLEVLLPLLWFILFFSYLKEIANDELERSRSKLKKSEEQFRLMFEKAAVGILMVDMDDRKYKKVNPAFLAMSGLEEAELLRKNPQEMTHIEDWPAEEQLLLELYAKKRDQYQMQKRYLRKDGGYFWGQITTTKMAIGSQNPDYTITFIQDISKRKEAEETLRENEEKLARLKKMESLGMLAGGVAHDLNNVLSGIVGYPELILQNLSKDSELRKPLETIRASGQRATAIVKDLLTVARGVAKTKKPLNLNHVIKDYLSSPEYERLREHHLSITVSTDLNPDLLNISAAYDHVRKVVMNLVSNAVEAIEEKGKVTLSTFNRSIDRPLKGYDEILAGDYAVIAVSDDGPGISTDDLSRIFEPFYTKKVMGRSGTGLGLAVVWNVVQDHKGYINVTTGRSGTTFELYFPITMGEISEDDRPISIDDYKGKGETILVVDDVGSQREITCKMLEILGYKPESVPSGETAVEYLTKNTADLLILDMIMDPGINGRETFSRIKKILPNQKAIIVSGFAETTDVKETIKLGAHQFLEKPLTLAQVAQAVKEVLKK